MVDQTNAILTKSLRSIEKSLGKVAKKKFKDDPEVGLSGHNIINKAVKQQNWCLSKNNQFSHKTASDIYLLVPGI